MNIKCKKDDLLSGINIVSKAVASKTSLPILECIMVEAMNGKIRLIANNIELGIETYIEGTTIEEGKAAFEAKIFSDIIRKLPQSDISIETDSDYKAKIVCEKSKFTIPYHAGDDFPYLQQIEKDNSIRISQFSLREIIRQTIFSISDNENTKLMTGESFEVKNNELIVVSLDGHRISRRKIALNGENSDMKVVVPGKSLIELSKIISGDSDNEVAIYFSDNHMLFEFDNTRVVTRLIEGEYFKISQMMAINNDLKVTVNRKELMGCIDRATLLIQETDKKPIIVSVKNDNNMYVRLDTNMGSLNEELEIKKEGNEIIIGFNPRFLMDALRVIDDEEIDIYLNDSKSPCFIKDSEESYIYIILPININVAAY